MIASESIQPLDERGAAVVKSKRVCLSFFFSAGISWCMTNKKKRSREIDSGKIFAAARSVLQQAQKQTQANIRHGPSKHQQTVS